MHSYENLRLDSTIEKYKPMLVGKGYTKKKVKITLILIYRSLI